jgi:hypothetical protein
MRGVTRALLGALAVLAVGAGTPAAGITAVKFTRVGTIPGLGGAVADDARPDRRGTARNGAARIRHWTQDGPCRGS